MPADVAQAAQCWPVVSVPGCRVAGWMRRSTVPRVAIGVPLSGGELAGLSLLIDAQRAAGGGEPAARRCCRAGCGVSTARWTAGLRRAGCAGPQVGWKLVFDTVGVGPGVHGVAVADVEVKLGVEGVSSPAGRPFRVESEDGDAPDTVEHEGSPLPGKVSRVYVSVVGGRRWWWRGVGRWRWW